MTPSRRTVLFVLLAALDAPAAHAAPPPAPPGAAPLQLERYRSTEPPLALYRPRGWIVTPRRDADGLRVEVTDPEGVSGVEVAFGTNPGQLDSAALLAATLRDLRRQHPELTTERASLCRDGASCATADLGYRRHGVAVRGRLFVHAGLQLSVVRRYQARAERFEAERPMLLEVLTNLRVGGAHRVAPVALAPRRAPDGSLTVSLPADWQLQAAQGKAVASAPGGGAGFLFTAFQVHPPALAAAPPGVIRSAWQPPERFVRVIWEKFGNREVRVLQARPDADTAAGCPASIGRACDAADVLLTWVSPKGRACSGSVKLLDSRPGPLGQWFSIVAGIWGPSDGLEAQLPTLEAVAASFAIQDRYARGYLQQGAARLRAMQAETGRKVRGLYATIEEGQRDYERRTAERDAGEARRDDYRRGNTYWISDLEGGKVYATDPWGTKDTTTGDRFEGDGYRYLHFEGQNPNHPSEQMRELSSAEVQQLEGRR